MEPTLAELAEDTALHLLRRPGIDLIEREGYVYEAGPVRGAVHRLRLADVPAAVEWAHAESIRRRHRTLEWWVGAHAEPAGLAERLLALGLVPDDVPTLTGMTCAEATPRGPRQVEVRAIETVDEQLAALEVDWDVWGITEDEREQRRAIERTRFGAFRTVSTHFAAYLDGRLVGFGRAEDMERGVALMGGAVLPEARGRGVYRALVRARWDHAAARGTPLLVVQAGAMSAPILAGLGFEGHGVIRLFVDPGVASRHGDDRDEHRTEQ